MDIIELQCPTCNDLLELDAGFAGGVCRCSSCGTLMTVPADPSRQRAERLSRPDRPDSPGASVPYELAEEAAAPQRVASPARSGNGAPRVTRPAARSAAGGNTATGTAGKDAARGASGGPQTYVTASGRTVQVAQLVPTARKRKRPGVRVATVMVFVLVMALVVGVVIAALVIAARPPVPKKTVGTGAVAPQQPEGVAAGVNPLKTTRAADFFGLTLGHRTSFVVDCSYFAKDWFGPMTMVLAATAEHARTGDALQVVLWTDLGTKLFPEQPQALDADGRAKLHEFLQNAAPMSSKVDPAGAVDVALRGKPDRVILVAGTEPDGLADIVKWADKSGTPFDVVVIGDRVPSLKKLAEGHGGKYVSMPVEDFKKWFDEAYPEPAKEPPSPTPEN
jgi:hypothetical protein